jgi:RNA polymerase sigma-70 factor (ECF subfamily)
LTATDATDEQLMLAFRDGSAAAFEQLVLRHRPRVFHFILRSVREAGRAEDLLQETWLRVIRTAGTYEPKARFTTWLYSLARNLCLDSSRRDRSRPTEPLGEAPMSQGLPDDAASPERQAHDAQVRPLLEQALADLPPEQCEVFILREYSGIQFKEIAKITGASEPTVKSRMRYALQTLRQRLTELGVEGAWSEPERSATG